MLFAPHLRGKDEKLPEESLFKLFADSLVEWPRDWQCRKHAVKDTQKCLGLVGCSYITLRRAGSIMT